VSIIVTIPIDKEAEGKGFSSIKVLINSSRSLPFTIPHWMTREDSDKPNVTTQLFGEQTAPVAPVDPNPTRAMAAIVDRPAEAIRLSETLSSGTDVTGILCFCFDTLEAQPSST